MKSEKDKHEIFSKESLLENRKGFSLLEVVFALFVMTAGIVAIILVMSRSIAVTNNSRDMLIASQLSQEGIELAKNYAENNKVAFLALNGDYVIDSTNAITAANAGNSRLKISGSKYLYSVGNKASKFLRKIRLSTDGNGNKVVVSTVIWVGTDLNVVCNAQNSCISSTAIFTK